MVVLKTLRLEKAHPAIRVGFDVQQVVNYDSKYVFPVDCMG